MTQEFKDLTKSYIPTISVIGIIATLGLAIWFTATKTAEIEQLSAGYKDVVLQIRDVPTRTEYNDLKFSISEFRGEFKTSIDNLSKEIRAIK